MSWRTVMVTKPSKLDYSMGYLVVRTVENTLKVHLSEISVLMIENTACSLTCVLLSELASKKIKVIFCDAKRNPQSELMSYYGSYDCSQKVKNQIAWDEISKQQAWTVIVARKIKNQSALLAFYGLEEAAMLEKYVEELEFYDATNREGHAAKVYFNALFGKSFTRSDCIPTNAALNYGYAILLSCFNREVVSCGYLTTLGLFHGNMFNRFNLSCDLMEPFRPIIDNLVKNMAPQRFEKEEKKAVLSLLNIEVVIDGRTNTLINAIKIYCLSIFSAIEENDVSLIKFPTINYEL